MARHGVRPAALGEAPGTGETDVLVVGREASAEEVVGAAPGGVVGGVVAEVEFDRHRVRPAALGESSRAGFADSLIPGREASAGEVVGAAPGGVGAEGEAVRHRIRPAALGEGARAGFADGLVARPKRVPVLGERYRSRPAGINTKRAEHGARRGRIPIPNSPVHSVPLDQVNGTIRRLS